VTEVTLQPGGAYPVRCPWPPQVSPFGSRPLGVLPGSSVRRIHCEHDAPGGRHRCFHACSTSDNEIGSAAIFKPPDTAACSPASTAASQEVGRNAAEATADERKRGAFSHPAYDDIAGLAIAAAVGRFQLSWQSSFRAATLKMHIY
jgi:hypothetical protein